MHVSLAATSRVLLQGARRPHTPCPPAASFATKTVVTVVFFFFEKTCIYIHKVERSTIHRTYASTPTLHQLGTEKPEQQQES